MSTLKHSLPYRAVRFYLRKIKEDYRTRNWNTLSLNKETNNLELLKMLKGKHEGKRCFIIGNGPSLKGMDLDVLKDDVTIAANGFALKTEETGFLPTYYLAEDPLVFKNFGNQIKKYYSSTTKIFPIDCRKYFNEPNSIYVNFLRSYMRSNDSKFPLFSKNFSEQVYYGATVAYMMFQFALYLGFNSIYLIGMDLNYKIGEGYIKKGNLIVAPKGFNEKNHFYNDENIELFCFVPDNIKMQKSFTNAYHELQKEEVSLWNATIGGSLKDIPRIDITKVL